MPTDITAALTPDGTPWVPEFPGQRPPFMPGNTAALNNRGPLTHGVYSLRRVEPLAREIVAELRATDGLDYLKAARFTTALWAYARAAAKAELVQQWIDGMAPGGEFAAGRGKDSPSEMLRQLQTRAGNLGDLIGLSPTGANEHADEIRQARETLRRKAERVALHDGLVEVAREAWFPDD